MRALQRLSVLAVVSGFVLCAANAQITYPDWWDTAEYRSTDSFVHDNMGPDETFAVFVENLPAPSNGPIEVAVELHYTWDGFPVTGPDTFVWLEFVAPQAAGQPVGSEPMDVLPPETTQADGVEGDMTRVFTARISDPVEWEGTRFMFEGDLFPGSGTVIISCDIRAHAPAAGCAADLDGDGDTDLGDLAVLLASYGIDAGGDLDGDGTTDLADLAILLADYGCGT